MTTNSRDDLRWTSAREIRDLIASRALSPVDVMSACLRRIEILDPRLHAFVTVAAEAAMQHARQAEQAVVRGESLGPLHGVPIALKDELWTSDMASTGGSLMFKRFVPSHDGTVAERLRRAGAIIVGKTNLPEFAAWPRSRTRLVGEVVNPWDTTRISGASSGGSAAAVVSGMVPVAIGSDGGGSIRIPSALCGAVGIYPTPGRVPSYGSFSYVPAGSMGPIARDVFDLAIVQQVIAGHDPRDFGSLSEPSPDLIGGLTNGVGGVRIAWSPDFGRIPVDPRVAAAARSAVAAFDTLGAHVSEITTRIEHPWGDGSLLEGLQAAVASGDWSLDELDTVDVPDLSAEQEWMWEVFAGPVPLTATVRFRELCRTHRRLLTPAAQLVSDFPADESGALPPGVPAPEELHSVMDKIFESCDVLCSPTMAVIAPPARDDWASPYVDAYMGTNFTFIANATGRPAASVPCGHVDGLPVGLQVIGRRGDEATVLRVCQAYAAAHPGPHPIM